MKAPVFVKMPTSRDDGDPVLAKTSRRSLTDLGGAGDTGKVSAEIEGIFAHTRVLSPFDAKVTLLWRDAPPTTRGCTL
jgi:hypothetical protein